MPVGQQAAGHEPLRQSRKQSDRQVHTPLVNVGEDVFRGSGSDGEPETGCLPSDLVHQPRDDDDRLVGLDGNGQTDLGLGRLETVGGERPLDVL